MQYTKSVNKIDSMHTLRSHCDAKYYLLVDKSICINSDMLN